MTWKLFYIIMALLSAIVGCIYSFKGNYTAGAYYWILYLVNVNAYQHSD